MKSQEGSQVKKKKADLKVVMIGDAAVGKTCLLHRYLHNEFNDQSPSTIGAAFFLKPWGTYNIAIWDTAGEEKFSGLSGFYCRGANAAIVAYDITNKDSFDSIEDRYTSLLQTAADNCSIVLTGTKKDLVTTFNREVTIEEGMSMAQGLCERWNSKQHPSGKTPFFETSSLTGENVRALFDYIFETLTLVTDDKVGHTKDTIDLGKSDMKPTDFQNKSKCSC